MQVFFRLFCYDLFDCLLYTFDTEAGPRFVLKRALLLGIKLCLQFLDGSEVVLNVIRDRHVCVKSA